MAFLFLSSNSVRTIVGIHHLDANETYEEKSRLKQHKNATSFIQQIPGAGINKTAVARPLTSHLTKYEQDMCATGKEIKINS